ncbi:baseplate J/gp47 family protein [Caballeronia sp. LZ001]|uniref:baseplate J/gp47 family protein n=1 Tax=Caballeronia sp. LZ001 TaxID=3038553 RepID=UPI002864DCEF|nr:baseplate J/gp47 family protein [Caballeronia sp. LZ001]MDR5800053.1 baseplate J/gp47 family protein [Caballeronia sp. LZ001]
MSATPIDLSKLPSPDIIETIDFETLLSTLKAKFVSLHAKEEQAEISETLKLESEPIVRLLQLLAYREMTLRQRVNDAARRIMLAYAIDADLDHLAALVGIKRQTITPANPEKGTKAKMEGNADLRARVQLAPQRFSVAGPEGAYISLARNAHAHVLDATAISPAPCEVLVTILSRLDDGAAEASLIDAVVSALSASDVRPLTDKVTVKSAEVIKYEVRARLTFFSGPDRAVALEEANKTMKGYAEQMHRLGMEVTLDGIYAAARAPGVQKVVLEQPLQSIKASKTQAPYCTSIELIDDGVYSLE